MSNFCYPLPILNDKVLFVHSIVAKLVRNKMSSLLDTMAMITPEMSFALKAIQHHGALSQQELADVVCSERSTMKRLVDNLERHGWIDISKHPNNKKLKIISLSALGIEKITEVDQVINAFESSFLDSLSPEEEKELLRLNHKLLKSNHHHPII